MHILYIMKGLRRTQIYLEADVLERLRWQAKQRRTTLAALVRKALEEFMREERPSQEQDSAWGIVGLVRSGYGALAEEHDAFLYPKRRGRK